MLEAYFAGLAGVRMFHWDHGDRSRPIAPNMKRLGKVTKLFLNKPLDDELAIDHPPMTERLPLTKE